MAPTGAQVDSVPFELDDQVPRASIALDDTHIEDEELEDELQSYALVDPGKAVPTAIQWKAPGDRVYVTGTFVNWEKKFRLHKRYGFFNNIISFPQILRFSSTRNWPPPANISVL
jgi:hypothetical protein